MLTAAAEALEELGYTGMTVAEIVSRAGVSRKTFYDTFTDREDCFLALLDATVAEAATLVAGEYSAARHWRTGIRAALGALLPLMESQPALAQLWVLETLKGGERALKRRAQLLDELARAINEGRVASSTRYEPPDVVAVGLVGGILEILRSRLLRSPTKPLTDLLGPLMYMIVLPYLGERSAREELTKPIPKAAPRQPRLTSTHDLLDGINMRLTYRTLRVLGAIGEQPLARNRAIAAAAGIEDQGQVSKLLSRLSRLELIENHGTHEKGAPNAWRLTPRGEQLLLATTTHRFASV